jgi:hypothetical protein
MWGLMVQGDNIYRYIRGVDYHDLQKKSITKKGNLVGNNDKEDRSSCLQPINADGRYRVISLR